MRYRQLARQQLDIKIDNGSEVYCLCPFHDDHRPSFSFNTHSGLWVCHGCGESGNVEQLLRSLGNPNLPSATTDDLQNALQEHRHEPGPRVYPEGWLEQFTSDLPEWFGEYIHDRWNVTPKIRSEFRIGWDNAALAYTIPLHDQHGRLVGVNRRMTKGNVKYKYPKRFQRKENLFAYHRVNMHPRILGVTEGCFDSLSLWAAGIPSVAVYGSHMSDRQQTLMVGLNPKSVLIASDNDKAGKELGEQVAGVCAKYSITYEHLAYEEDEDDPCDIPLSDLVRMSS